MQASGISIPLILLFTSYLALPFRSRLLRFQTALFIAFISMLLYPTF